MQNRLGRQGRTRCVAEFVRLLNELGEEPRIVCLTFEDPDSGRAFGMSDLRYRLSTLIPLSRMPDAHRSEVLLTNLLAARLIRRLQPDLVFNSNNPWAFLPAGPRYIHYLYFSFMASFRYMSRFNRGLWKSYASILSLLLHEDDPPPNSQLVVSSDFVRATFSETHALNARVIYPPCWSGELTSCRSDRRRVVTLGSFHPDKRQLIRSRSRGGSLTGPSRCPATAPLRHYVRKVQRAARHAQDVELLLNPSRQRIEEEFAPASHFVHTNPEEGFGIATVEAAAAGCIPVVPRRGGVREIVEPDELRFTSIDECVTALRRSSSEAGCDWLRSVQKGSLASMQGISLSYEIPHRCAA